MTFRTYLDYHLEEVAIRPSAVEVKLVNGEDVILSEFTLPTTVDSASLSADWRYVQDGDVVELTLSRALKTLPGLHPRRAVRKQNPRSKGTLSKVTLIAG